MKLRYYAAFTTGALVLILTVGALWFFTHLQLHDIAFIATIAYHVAIFVVLAVTEGRRPHDR